MKITIEATEKITHLEGVRVRLWEGQTESGVKCKVFVHQIAVHNEEDPAEFERELKEQMPPGQVFSLRDIL